MTTTTKINFNEIVFGSEEEVKIALTRKRGRPNKEQVAKREAALVWAANHNLETEELTLNELTYKPYLVNYGNLEEVTSKVTKEVLEKLRGQADPIFIADTRMLLANLIALWKSKKLEDLWKYYNEIEGSITMKQVYADSQIRDVVYNIEFLNRLYDSLLTRLETVNGK